MKRTLVVLGATLLLGPAMVLTAGASASGSSDITLQQDAPALAPQAVGETLSCDLVETGDRTASGPQGCTPEDERLVPAVGYECADGSMVYSTDTGHGRDGERWSVAYDAARELEALC